MHSNLYMVASVTCSSTPYYAHAWLYKRCGYYAYLSVPCTRLVNKNVYNSSRDHHIEVDTGTLEHTDAKAKTCIHCIWICFLYKCTCNTSKSWMSHFIILTCNVQDILFVNVSKYLVKGCRYVLQKESLPVGRVTNNAISL